MSKYLSFAAYQWPPYLVWLFVLIFNLCVLLNVLSYEEPSKSIFLYIGLITTTWTLVSPFYLGLRLKSIRDQRDADIKLIQALHKEQEIQEIIKCMHIGKDSNANN